MTAVDLDLVVVGPTFLDVSLAGVAADPRPGQEVFAEGAAIGPGGAATAAITAARLGLRVALGSTLGDDRAGAWCRDVLAAEHVDTSAVPALGGWATPVTVCLSQAGDRSMITHQSAAPPRAPLPPSRAVLADVLEVPELTVDGAQLVVADIGWDSSGIWDAGDLAGLSACDVFLPNAAEAMAYTRTEAPRAAARALGERVERVIVTCGADGAVAFDASTGAEVIVPAIPAHAIDPTGAGDVLAAAVVFGLLQDWALQDIVAFGTLSAGLAVQSLGSGLSAPDLAVIRAWKRRSRSDRQLSSRYEFLDAIL